MQQVKNRISFTYNYSDVLPWVKLNNLGGDHISINRCVPFYLEIHDALHHRNGLSA